MHPGFVAATVMAALWCGACGPGVDPGEPPPASTLVVTVLQYRSDITAHRVQIKVTNVGEAPVTVTAAKVTSSLFSGDVAWTARDAADRAVIGPGGSTDLPAPIPPPTCAGGATATATATASVAGSRVDLTDAGGEVVSVVGSVADPYELLPRLNSTDCRLSRAREIADLRIDVSPDVPLPTTTVGGRLTGVLTLVLAPTGRPGRLTVDSVSSTTLLSSPDGAGWTIDREVSASSGEQRIELLLRPTRCDAHAFGEDKVGTVLSVTLHIDDEDGGVVSLPADPRQKASILTFLRRACS